MSDHEQSRTAFEALYRHPNTYDASQSVRDHIRQTNEIAWEAWTRALDYAANRECVWEHDEYNCAWDTACGEKYCFETGGPAENAVRFCHGCGGRVKIQPQTTTEE